MIFLFSSPRSGSTLLRAMLMGNSDLFSPPELHLLNYDNLMVRSKSLFDTPLYDGLLEVIKIIYNYNIEEAKDFLKQLEKSEMLIEDVYELIMNKLGDKILIDKSPSYASDLTILKKSLSFKKAKFLLLVRHPLAVIESIVRNRFHAFLPNPEGKKAPIELAEDVWYNYYKNIMDFVEHLTPDQYVLIQYEDLVYNPKKELTKICDFIGVRFAESMLNPYQDSNMIHGLTEGSKSVGDPNFLKHNDIDKSLSTSWKDKIDKSFKLKPLTIALANQYNYNLESSNTLHSKHQNWFVVNHVSFSCNHIVNENSLAGNCEKFWTIIQPFFAAYTNNESIDKDNGAIIFDFFDEANYDFLQAALEKFKVKESSLRSFYIGVSKCKNDTYELVIVYPHVLFDGISSLSLTNMFVNIVKQNNIDINKLKIDHSETLLQLQPAQYMDLELDEEARCFPQKEMSQEVVFKEINNEKAFFYAGRSFVDAVKSTFDLQKFKFSYRYHNRSGLLNKGVENIFDAIGAFARDHVFDSTIFNKKEEKNKIAIDSLSGSSLKGKIRLNFQPNMNYDLFSYDLLKTKDFRLDNLYSYDFDCILRIHRSKLIFSIKYDPNLYSEKYISDFLNEWKQRFYHEVYQDINQYKSLADIRKDIDDVDNKIINLVKHRIEITSKAHKFKNTEYEVRSPLRKQEVIEKVCNKAINMNIEPQVIKNIYEELIEYCINEQMKLWKS